MNEISGQEIYQSLCGVRRLHGQVALLLKTAGAWFQESEFRMFRGSKGVGSRSESLERPERWDPDTLFRFVRPPVREDLVAYVSVLLCPRDPSAHARRFDEPLVSGGWVRFDGDVQDKDDLFGWANVIAGFDVPRDGTVARGSSPPDEPPIAQGAAVEWLTFAHPLVQVSDSNQLHDRILEPLVRRMAL